MPGWYRSTKNWDLIVADKGTLVAALELKGLGANSAGNNFNNRTEEAIGNATDLWLAHDRTACFGPIRPWAGFMFLMEDAPNTRIAVREQPSKWRIDSEFEGSSYLKRGVILSSRMLHERLYDAVCFVTSTNDPGVPPMEPVVELNWMSFVAAIQARVQYVKNTQTAIAK